VRRLAARRSACRRQEVRYTKTTRNSAGNVATAQHHGRDGCLRSARGALSAVARSRRRSRGRRCRKNDPACRGQRTSVWAAVPGRAWPLGTDMRRLSFHLLFGVPSATPTARTRHRCDSFIDMISIKRSLEDLADLPLLDIRRKHDPWRGYIGGCW
jgi:hypothetical protein